MSKPDIDFHKMFCDMPAGYMVLDMELRFIEMNDSYLHSVDRTREDLLGKFVFDAFPEKDERRKVVEAAFAKALAGESNSLIRVPFALQSSAENGGKMKTIYWNCHHVPVYDKDGELCGVLQRAEDVTAEVDAERMRDVVLKELNHRVKNHLTIISAIARRTASVSGDTETFLKTFEQRIGALARTHQLLVDGNWDGLTLKELVSSELQPYCEDSDQKVSIEGPEIVLTNAQAQSLGLAIHELTTNAAKYGALNGNSGRLEVSWNTSAPDGNIAFDWNETGLRGVKVPVTSGFGSTILDRILPAEITAKVTREFQDDGLRCRINIPQAQS